MATTYLTEVYWICRDRAGVEIGKGNDMEATGIFIAIFISLFIALFLLVIVMSGKQWREAEEKARASRLADAKMDARLLRLNL
jgi:Na+-driven multidrug efflux pump